MSSKLYVINSINNIFEKICPTLKLLKTFDIYFCHYFPIAIIQLWHVMELKTICHLIVKDKVAEQHILKQYSNCKSFGVTKALLTGENFKVAITQLFNVQQV